MTLSSEKINDLSTPGLNWHSHLMKFDKHNVSPFERETHTEFKDRKVDDIYGCHIMVLQRKLSLWILYKESNTCYVPWCFFLMFKGFLNIPLDFTHGVPWSPFSFTSAAKKHAIIQWVCPSRRNIVHLILMICTQTTWWIAACCMHVATIRCRCIEKYKVTLTLHNNVHLLNICTHISNIKSYPYM